MKITGWYSGDQKPVREGVYQRIYDGGCIYYCYWNGYVFGFGERKAEKAKHAFEYHGPSGHQNLPWRGVLK